ncbi:hypothetical protein [Galbitalea soli]|uniref:Uncharacterized protein n=1 Tax=Galbitalea soli TaxID=1268042 RepID=A0A7C9PM13_9MICO|nr:hypothetical protein [Galbitalea soli]NEM90408.1 hypothetical protein [Galbitalea soli]NYJ31119.1 hypothetical protein [Galbitalea soli]
MSTTPSSPKSSRAVGVGRVLITVYAILAIGATSRSVFQIITEYSSAPLAITLSAVSSVVYILATVALILPGTFWYRVAWVTISFELAGVLIVGTLSLVRPDLFAHNSVWSYYGIGYLLIPLVLPVLGMLWLRRRAPGRSDA